MLYKNQLVLTGALNDVGSARRVNVDKSYRRGIEIECVLKPNKFLDLNGNITLSQNEITNFESVVSNYDDTLDFINKTNLSTSTIAYSPSVIAAAIIAFHPLKNMDIALQNKFVGKQFLDNTSDERKKLDSYFVSDLRLGYTFKIKSVKEISLNFIVNNVFNTLYTSNGYTYNWFAGGREYYFNHYYPQAGINILGGVSLKF
jgi:iron complex outermembrane receptor protein